MDNRPIGYFDSGIGGLTALKEHFSILPEEDIIYVSDEAHLPYGTKSYVEVTQLSRKIIEFLISKNVKAIVCACNTASALAIPTLQKEFSLPITGVVCAGSQKSVEVTKNKKIAVIATEATIRSQKFNKIIYELDPHIEVFGYPAQSLVDLIEKGNYKFPQSQKEIKRILSPLQDEIADTLILGCTHFPIIEDEIAIVTNHRFKMVNPGRESVKQLKKYLLERDLIHEHRSDKSLQEFYTTGDLMNLKKVGAAFLNQPIKEVKILNLENKWKK